MASGGCCGGGHHHSPDPGTLDPAKDRSAEFSLHTKINWSEFKVLNASREEDGRKVFKDWKDRLSDEVRWMCSLLIHARIMTLS